ncbi:hypothetical protein P7L53_08525 [Thermoleptolyngbya sichuanensis XZ-Cy5]|nr:hypothetical protein [Thermoleptolyngbya sichuanensis]MDG2616288.1 hypothetical protein [Thermoleptolyngbya sichuanensis XZ-Cy5]
MYYIIPFQILDRAIAPIDPTQHRQHAKASALAVQTHSKKA